MLILVRAIVLSCLLIAAGAARADDVFYRVPVSRLTLTEGALPDSTAEGSRRWDLVGSVFPYVALDGPGEAFLVPAEANSGFDDTWAYRWSVRDAYFTAKVPAGTRVSGSLFVPASDWSRLVRLRFTLDDQTVAADAKQSFFRAKAVYYEHLQSTGAAGAAFFRYQADSARRELPPPADSNDRALRGQRRELSDTYDLFTGGSAVSENLQLTRELPGTRRGTEPDAPDEMVPLTSVEGITVKEIDWSARLAGASPALDPLASAIPADQHAVFFPSFAALMTVLDEASDQGLPVFRSLQPRSEDGRLAERYERQLCLSRSVVSRLLGPSVIRSVAVTGSDPYFPTGTDVAVLFQANNPEALRQLLLAQVKLAAQAAGTQVKSGAAEGVHYEGAATEDRSVCSYVAVVGKAVAVTNSLTQLKRLGAVASGTAKALDTLPEYRFFRSRYTLGDAGETAFVFLSDATIRRWCGPEWRIGASRRLRAAAVMADTAAAHVDELGAGLRQTRPVTADTPMRTIGTLTIGPSGIASSVYGSAGFLTPISELGITEAPKDEAASYKRWRDTYQRNWSWAFDPIAVRLGVAKERLSADLSIMPLIVASEYRTWMSIAQGASLAPGSGDPHDAIAHGVLAINPESPAVKQASGFGRMMAPNLEIDPLSWLGGALALYADADPFWEEMLAAGESSEFFSREMYRLPVGLYVEVGSALKLTAFLTAARSFVEQSSPGMTAWETRDHKGQPYVRVGMSEKAKAEARNNEFDKVAIYYAATPRALIVSLNEDVLKRAIDRQNARSAEGAKPAPGGEWLGSSLALRFTREGLSLVQGPGRDALRHAMRQRSWANIPILNEWKHRFPDQDPLKVHEKLWGTRLVCPGGGNYVWNDASRTMESTVYGHPGEPKEGPSDLGPLNAVRAGDFGVSFEGDGLRARAALERAPK